MCRRAPVAPHEIPSSRGAISTKGKTPAPAPPDGYYRAPPGKFGPALSLQPGKRHPGSAGAARASPRAASAPGGDAQRVSPQTRIPPTAGCSAGKQQPSPPRCQHGAEPSPPRLNGNRSPGMAVPVLIPWDTWAGCARSSGKGTAPRGCSGVAEHLGSPRGLLAWERQGTAGPNPGQGKHQPERPRRRILARGSPKHSSAFSGTPVPFGEVTCRACLHASR